VAPRVSVIVPARNEAGHIEACVRSVLAQEVDGGLEVIVADGRSSDATGELAQAAGARVIDNPEGITPTALNRGLHAARGDIILRFDAHSEMSERYIEACLRAIDEEKGAVNVGGWCEVQGTGPWGRAVASALASRVGVGNPRLWRRPAEGAGREDVETVPFGCFSTSVLRDAGGWRADLVRNQDFELNHRLRAAGGRIVFDPDIWFIYRPRESLVALWRQYWTFGRWKAVMLTGAPTALKPRQLAPLALLATVAAAAVPNRRMRFARVALAVYGSILGAATIRSDGGWRTFPVLATMHVAWGSGLVTELLARRIRSSAS
jgi:glycosyltransferase involved in cell wall biosynthesis